MVTNHTKNALHICACCKGLGIQHGTNSLSCIVCRGKGKIIVHKPYRICLECKGKAMVEGSNLYCLKCKGKGIVEEFQESRVTENVTPVKQMNREKNKDKTKKEPSRTKEELGVEVKTVEEFVAKQKEQKARKSSSTSKEKKPKQQQKESKKHESFFTQFFKAFTLYGKNKKKGR